MMAAGTVTLDKVYFETILRRAQFHTDGVDYSTPVDVRTVTIPKGDHDSLLDSARQYANLRRNLFRGGIAEETLTILIRDDSSLNGSGTDNAYPVEEPTNAASAASVARPQNTSSGANGGQDYTFGRNANYTPRSNFQPRDTNASDYNLHSQNNDDYGFMPEENGFYDEGSGNNESQQSLPRSSRQQYDKFAKRTILLCNLPEGTSHAEVTDVVRGGMLLDIYLRTHDRTASVSFLEEAAAQDFFRHVKRHDLYIRGKRVDIRWNDRQFILPGHVASKVAIGATRNLVIYNRNARHTEELIRDDLEHIHNLAVISIGFDDQNAYISTNSVHNAMFARTCMMSRGTYKGYKIEWDVDECASALERPVQARHENIPSKKAKKAPLMNRFQLLNMDGSEDGTDDDNDTSVVTLPTLITPSTATTVFA